jgi:hypothetical protein
MILEIDHHTLVGCVLILTGWVAWLLSMVLTLRTRVNALERVVARAVVGDAQPQPTHLEYL